MHILLTDITSCPRCGPGFGLILMVEAMHERRVRQGWLGCANCRERYRIAEGIADLRVPGTAGSDDAAAAPAGPDPAAADRIAALAGVTQGPAYLLVAGPAARHAAALAELLPDVHIIALHEDAHALPDHPAVSRARVSDTLPFYSGRMAGVVLSGSAASRLLEEGARVLSPLGRLVLEDTPPDAAPRLDGAGLRIAASADTVTVAVPR
jgi:uncharacterized protein YbaR (Trm112 family)